MEHKIQFLFIFNILTIISLCLCINKFITNKNFQFSPQTSLLSQSQIIYIKDEEDLLKTWLPQTNPQFTLLYSAAIDGDEPEIFHAKCDNLKPTLTLIKTTNDNRFGGYTEATWTSPTFIEYKNDPSAFIFSINKSTFYKTSNPKRSLRCWKGWGPVFGGYSDIFAAAPFLKNKESHTTTPWTYKTKEKSELNGGETNFLITQMEVYLIH